MRRRSQSVLFRNGDRVCRPERVGLKFRAIRAGRASTCPFAAWRGTALVVDARLDAGSDPAARDRMGMRPADVAEENLDNLRGTEALRRLEKAGE